MNELFIRSARIDWQEIPQDSYLHAIEAIRGLEKIDFHRPITFFAGENGSGKSTLLEALAVACGFNAEGGSRNYRFSTYDSHSQLCDAMRIVRGVRRPKWGYFLRAESFYNVATAEEGYQRAFSRKYHMQSHGESFLNLMQSQMSPEGIYFFDEPEAALSPQRQLTLLYEMRNCAQAGSQLIVATHSPILLGTPDAEILSFDEGSVHPCRYEDTASYQITKMFLNDRESLLRRMLDTGD